MKTITLTIFLCFTIFLPAQTDTSQSNSWRIFGDEKNYNGTVLLLDNKDQVVHSSENCSLVCANSEGKEKWKIDLSRYKCKLIYFSKIKKAQLKSFDAVLQFENKDIYLLNSTSGKMREIKPAEFEKLSNDNK